MASIRLKDTDETQRETHGKTTVEFMQQNNDLMGAKFHPVGHKLV